MSYEPPNTDDRVIWDIWLSTFRLPAMAVADELGVFKSIASAAATGDELAVRLGLDRTSGDALLAMLGSLGLLQRRETRWELTDAARTYLLPDSPFYWGPLLRTIGVVPHQRTALLRALSQAQASRPGGTDARPSDVWESGEMGPEQAERITALMHCHSLPAAIAAGKSGAFEGVTRLLDVGGGSGCYAIAIARSRPNVRCTVMDLPAVGAVARRYIEEGGVSDRIDVVSVDMFRAAWPKGYDGIFLSNVFHDWDPTTNTQLARSAFEALPPGGRIFLHEMLMNDDGDGPTTTAAFSLLMVTTTRGHQYTLRELTEVLGSAGFVDVRAQATHHYYSIVSAQKPA